MSEEQNQTVPDIADMIPANISTAPVQGIDSVVKIKETLSGGVPSEPLLSPSLELYFTRVMNPIPIYDGTWSTTSAVGSNIFNDWISPTVPYWQSRYIPYWCHEAFKWAYYSGTFKLRVVFWCGDAYRGSLRIVRNFYEAGSSSASARAGIVHYHMIDGGNVVHEHDLRFSAPSNKKLTYPNLFPNSSILFKSQTIFYEHMRIFVRTALSVPSIYPTSIPFTVFLIPQSDLEFSVRRNNLAALIPTVTYDKYLLGKKVGTVTESISQSNIDHWLEN